MIIKEDAPVTTTDNCGAGLIEPKLPIKQNNMFRRISKLVKDKKALPDSK